MGMLLTPQTRWRRQTGTAQDFGQFSMTGPACAEPEIRTCSGPYYSTVGGGCHGQGEGAVVRD